MGIEISPLVPLDNITPMLSPSLEITQDMQETARELFPSLGWPDPEDPSDGQDSGCCSIESPQPEPGFDIGFVKSY